jgi:hypothetical protein
MAESYTSGKTYRRDDAGNFVEVESMPLSEGEMILAKRANQREMAGVLGATGAAGLAQGVIPYAFPTAQDVRNKEKLGALQAKEKAGRLGRDEQMEAYTENVMMNPVRAFATEQRARGEAERASTSATTSAAQQLREARVEAGTVAQAAQKTGMEKARQFFEKKAAETRELEQRTAYESEKKKNTLALLGNTIAGLAGLTGKYLAANVQETVTPEQLNAYLAQNPKMRGKSAKEILDAYGNWARSSTSGDISPRDATQIAAEQGGNVATPAPGSPGANI